MAAKRTTREERAPATRKPATVSRGATPSVFRASKSDLSYTNEAAVIARCADAAGLAAVKTGFGCTPERDVLFALGWPHLRLVRDDDTSHEDPKVAAWNAYLQYPPFRIEWPRALAEVLVRAWGTRITVTGSASEKMMKALDAVQPGPISAHEAAGLLANILRFTASRVPYEAEPVLLLEAMVGAVPVAKAVVTILDGLDAEGWGKARRGDAVAAFPLGYLLLRVPEACARELGDRLEKRWAKGATTSPTGELTRMVDVILHGSEGAKRSAVRLGSGAIHPRYLGLSGDDPAFVARSVAANEDAEGRDHARLSFLGGEAVVARYGKLWRTLRRPEEQEWFRWTMGEIRSPKVVAIMREMSTSSKVRKAAAAWLESRTT